jgi:hypothetical protein
VLAVRPYCHTSYYWQVYFDTNKLIASTFGAAGFPPPFTVEREEQVQFDRPGTPPTRTTKAKRQDRLLFCGRFGQGVGKPCPSGRS